MRLPLASVAVTRMLPAAPAVLGVVMPETTNLVRAVAFTRIPTWPPLISANAVSVAVTDWVPAVLRLILNVWTPASAALNV